MNEGTPSNQTQQSSSSGKPGWQNVLDATPTDSPNANLAAEAGGQGGSPQPSPGQSGATGDSSGQQVQAPGSVVSPQTPAVQTPASAAQIVQMDEATLARMVDAYAERTGQQAQQNQQQPAPTQEELDQLFNVYKPAAEHLVALGIEPTPERIKVVGDWLQGASKQAASVASFQLAHVVGQLKQELAQQLGPVMAFYQQQAAEGMKQRFYGKYPNLKGIEPLLLRIKDSFTLQQRKFKTEDEAFKAVADEALATLSSVGVTLGADGANNGGASPQQNQNGLRPSRMPALSGGGQGGAGDGTSIGQKKNWQKVLD